MRIRPLNANMPLEKSIKSSKNTLKPKSKKPRQRSIIIALDWYDERIVRGIYNYAREQNWHISPYLASGNFVVRSCTPVESGRIPVKRLIRDGKQTACCT